MDWAKLERKLHQEKFLAQKQKWPNIWAMLNWATERGTTCTAVFTWWYCAAASVATAVSIVHEAEEEKNKRPSDFAAIIFG